MKTFLSILLCILSIQSTFSQNTEFKIITFNIRCGHCDENTPNNWDSRKSLLADVLTNYKPDVVGFQEMIPLQRVYIAEQFPNYKSFGLFRDKDNQGEGCLIFYNPLRFELDSTKSGTFWFSSTPNVQGSSDMGDKYNRICTYALLKDKTTGKSFYHCNTHITYIDSLQSKYLNFLVQQLTKRLAANVPIIITGDFNADEKSEVILNFKKFDNIKSLSDSYRDIYKDGNAETFHGFTGKTDGKKIDFIFIEKGKFSITNSEIIRYNKDGKYPSDHFGIFAIMRLN